MQKIPTIFTRGPDFKVVPEWNPDCEWVASMSFATEKLDGTNVRVRLEIGGDDGDVDQQLWLDKRRNPSKAEKAAGVEPGYVMASRNDPADKHIYRALDNTLDAIIAGGVGEYYCEAIGPKIQGNPLALPTPRLVCFATQDGPEHSGLIGDSVPTIPLKRGAGRLTFDMIRDVVLNTNSLYQAGHVELEPLQPPAKIEGLVFHHHDGRMAKVKRKDFA